MILIIDRKETRVNYESNTLCIRRPDQALERIPLNLLEQLIVYGNPVIEIPVWRALAKAAIPTTLLSRRGGQEPAMIGSGLAIRLPFRRLQYLCAEQPSKALVIARWIIAEKFSNYNLLLSLFSEEQQQCFNQQRKALDLKREQASSIESLMGIEGALARLWFRLLADNLPKQWRFTGRNRRPPKDPFNSLLSLSYTLLMGELRQLLINEGLDPAFGFLHQPVAGREALVLDFTELFRGTVDFAMYLLVQQLSPTDFSYHETNGCRLTKQARPIYFKSWSEFREQCPRFSHDGNTMESVLITEQIRGKIMQFRDLLNVVNGAENG